MPKRMQRFAPCGERLYRPVTGETYALDYADQSCLPHWPELDMLVLGLNSAKDRGGIYSEAVSEALDLLRARPDLADCLKIAVLHHPIATDEPTHFGDNGFLEHLAAGFWLALHGHIREAEVIQVCYDPTPGWTFGAPSRQWGPGYPLQHQLLRRQGDRLTVETRCREEPNRAWKPDGRWLLGQGKDPVSRYLVELRGAG
jgi:hypothetical protein